MHGIALKLNSVIASWTRTRSFNSYTCIQLSHTAVTLIATVPVVTDIYNTTLLIISMSLFTSSYKLYWCIANPDTVDGKWIIMIVSHACIHPLFEANCLVIYLSSMRQLKVCCLRSGNSFSVWVTVLLNFCHTLKLSHNAALFDMNSWY